MVTIRSPAGIAPESAFSVVVLPDPVPPLTSIDARARTAAASSSAAAPGERAVGHQVGAARSPRGESGGWSGTGRPATAAAPPRSRASRRAAGRRTAATPRRPGVPSGARMRSIACISSRLGLEARRASARSARAAPRRPCRGPFTITSSTAGSASSGSSGPSPPASRSTRSHSAARSASASAAASRSTSARTSSRTSAWTARPCSRALDQPPRSASASSSSACMEGPVPTRARFAPVRPWAPMARPALDTVKLMWIDYREARCRDGAAPPASRRRVPLPRGRALPRPRWRARVLRRIRAPRRAVHGRAVHVRARRATA